MNVCILSKYPPLEGGIAARAYWLARLYAEDGMNVHVVSNANAAEKEYRIEGCYPHIQTLPGIKLHEVTAEFPWHIPNEPHSLAKLVDTALEVVKKNQIDVIDASYLVPYGIAAFLVSQLTGVPYIIRHGGSDLAKFLKAGQLRYLLKATLEGAAAIVTDPDHDEAFADFQTPREHLAPYMPNPKHFHTTERKDNASPNLLYLGKINWHWQRKGLDRILACLPLLPDDWEMHWVGQGRGEADFIGHAAKSPGCEVSLSPFIPPWRVPDLLRQSDYVFCLSVDEPIRSFSNVFAEAACCGATIVVDRSFDFKTYSPLLEGDDGLVLRVESENPESIARALIRHWREREMLPAKISTLALLYEAYRLRNLEIIRGAVSSVFGAPCTTQQTRGATR